MSITTYAPWRATCDRPEAAELPRIPWATHEPIPEGKHRTQAELSEEVNRINGEVLNQRLEARYNAHWPRRVGVQDAETDPWYTYEPPAIFPPCVACGAKTGNSLAGYGRGFRSDEGLCARCYERVQGAA